uniref:Nodulin-like domain-containing protein n=1 Tax=Fagus sylvatica TaxID=28930 RepID=A0A2N9G6N4_FAGSY
MNMDRLSNKWMATVASIWIQCSSGSYTFGVYSPILKSSQGYDQSTLETVAVFRDIGSSAGVLAGVLYSAITPSNNHSGFCGPWVVLLAGAIQNFLGYFLMWACVVGLIQPASRWPVDVSLHALVQSFYVHSSTQPIRFLGCAGISGAIIIQVYNTFYKGEPSTFILMLALLPTFVSLGCMLLVRIYKANTSDDKKHLNGFSAIALIIAGYLMIMIILENIFSLPSWARNFTFILLLILLASPLGIAIKAQKEDSKRFLKTFNLESNDAAKDQAYHELPSGEGEVNAALDEKNLSDEEGHESFASHVHCKLLAVVYCHDMWNGLYAGCDKQLESNRTISQLHYCGGE